VDEERLPRLPMMKAIEAIGRRSLTLVEEAGEIAMLGARVARWMFRRPFEWRNLLAHMMEVGVRSLPVVTLTAISTGMVLALQTSSTLEYRIQGISQFLGGIVALSMVRELGPVLTSLMVAGRVGSAIAAELGTMVVTEQVDALETMATSPVQYLAVPRVLACALMLPVLTVYADAIGIIGGGIVSSAYADVSFYQYGDAVRFYLRASDVMNGLIKTLAFGTIIGVVGCSMGFRTSGGAEGVGRATTRSVVVASILILIFDYILSSLLVASF